MVLVLFRQPLSERLWPEARAQELSDQAAQALARGRLTAADGTGARELYEAALAIDPDYGDARVGLALVAQVALTQARSATAQDRYAEAHRVLKLARALSVPRAQADAVETQLREREAAHAGIEYLLAEATAARVAHRLDGTADAALPLYRRVLALQPDRIEALEGREDALSELLQRARAALDANELANAAQLIGTARDYDAGHADLPDAQARLAKAVDQAHQRADDALRRGLLERAGDAYQTLLRIDPKDAIAVRGLDQVASAWTRRAERLASDFRFVDAHAALEQARALAPQAAAVRDAERAIARSQQAQGRLGARMPKAQRARRVRALLADAAAAEARGDLLTPPGDSAFDKLRAARALAPADPDVRRAGLRLLPVADACFERELRNNSLAKARACLDVRIALEGEGATVARARRRLAQRWVAIGNERLGAGELRRAQSALASARAVDPAVPGLDALASRLATASANGD